MSTNEDRLLVDLHNMEQTVGSNVRLLRELRELLITAQSAINKSRLDVAAERVSYASDLINKQLLKLESET